MFQNHCNFILGQYIFSVMNFIPMKPHKNIMIIIFVPENMPISRSGHSDVAT